MTYLRGALVKEAIKNIATSEQCSGIRCYAIKRASKLGSHYVGEAAQVIIRSAAGSAVVSKVFRCWWCCYRNCSKVCIKYPKNLCRRLTLCCWDIINNLFCYSYSRCSLLFQCGRHDFLWCFKTLINFINYYLVHNFTR